MPKLPVADAAAYIKKIMDLPRPGEENILAFYEYRLGMICKDPRLMLLPLDDHLAHRGDGVFETIKYLEGRMYGLDRHLERMKNSARGLFIEPPCPWDEIRDIVMQVAKAGGEANGMMRILLGRGPGSFSINPDDCPQASLYVASYRWQPRPESWYEKGLTGYRTTIPAKPAYLAKIKNTNYIPNVLMIREGGLRGMDVPFCFDQNGFLAESAIASLCTVDKNGCIVIPAQTNSLPGTTINRAIELLNNEIPHRISRVTEEDVIASSELLMLSTSPDCVAIISYEGHIIGDGKEGPVARRLRALIRRDILENGDPVPGLC